MKTLTFSFSPRWKEELVCSCALGSFLLEMPMGITSVYFPTESAWQQKAPEWARPYWTKINEQLARWCARQTIPLYVKDDAAVY